MAILNTALSASLIHGFRQITAVICGLGKKNLKPTKPTIFIFELETLPAPIFQPTIIIAHRRLFSNSDHCLLSMVMRFSRCFRVFW